MITAAGLTRRFGDQAVLDGLDLKVAAGERVALLGLNGAGKTTLFRCLLGILPFDGQLLVRGLDVREHGLETRAAIGYVPQRPPHFDGTLADLVAFFAGLRGVDPDAVGRGMASLDLSLKAHGGKAVRALSGGMLQKTLLALAVAQEVPILLLDEPTANLDPRARREFVRGLKLVPRRTAVLLSSHRLEDIRAVADRILVLHEGRIVFDGGLEDLSERADAAPILWILVASSEIDTAAAILENDSRTLEVRRNGVAVGARARPGDIADLLAEVHRHVAVEGIRVESPPLETMLRRHTEPSEPASGEER